MYLQEVKLSSIVMVRLDKSDSRCNVRLKSIVAEVYSYWTANKGELAAGYVGTGMRHATKVGPDYNRAERAGQSVAMGD
jgi:hypothetical protein